MGQSASGIHVAIIMDGNGRWAAARRLPRTAGHRAGAHVVRQVAEAAPGLGISMLTLYAFSSDNWQRPPREVSTLMRLLRRYLQSETATCIENDVRLRVLGRRDRLPRPVLRAVEAAEHATRDGKTLELRIAVDYSARDALVSAARLLRARHTESCRAGADGARDGAGSVNRDGSDLDRDDLQRALGEAIHAGGPAPDVDLLIRTGREQRLSDFLLWECAYAELYFSSRMWPEFTVADLAEAVRDFHQRERRFGRVAQVAG